MRHKNNKLQAWQKNGRNLSKQIVKKIHSNKMWLNPINRWLGGINERYNRGCWSIFLSYWKFKGREIELNTGKMWYFTKPTYCNDLGFDGFIIRSISTRWNSKLMEPGTSYLFILNEDNQEKLHLMNFI